MSRELKCIDLFSGCGGLSLGLRRAGFRPVLFCELSDHAAATYELNHPDVPRFADAVKLATNLRTPSAVKRLLGCKKGELDLLCGGPPCQGYSRIGHRRTHQVEREQIPSNHLFKSMVSIIRSVRPKMFLFENVSGILSGKWKRGGSRGEIFKDVLLGADGFGGLMYENGKFADKNASQPDDQQYLIRWQEIRCSEYGVPQNRPRVLIVGLRFDCASPAIRNAILRQPKSDDRVEQYRDRNHILVAAPTCKHPAKPWDLKDILADLTLIEKKQKDPTQKNSPLCSFRRGKLPRHKEVRDWYLAQSQDWLNSRGFDPEKGPPPLTEQEYSKHKPRVVERFELIRGSATDEEIEKRGLATKKFAQRMLPPVWGQNRVGITVTSLPDDFVHFAEPRALTVREWARLQTFPDWFRFAGPRTTGGTRRAGNPSENNWHRDVPRYTQIGNAVPVKLAHEMGMHFAMLLGERAN